MCFGSRAYSVAAVEVGACLYILDCFGRIDEGCEVKKRKGVESTIEKAGVGFTPFVPGKRSIVSVLEVGDNYARSQICVLLICYLKLLTSTHSRFSALAMIFQLLYSVDGD